MIDWNIFRNRKPLETFESIYSHDENYIIHFIKDLNDIPKLTDIEKSELYESTDGEFFHYTEEEVFSIMSDKDLVTVVYYAWGGRYLR